MKLYRIEARIIIWLSLNVLFYTFVPCLFSCFAPEGTYVRLRARWIARKMLKKMMINTDEDIVWRNWQTFGWKTETVFE